MSLEPVVAEKEERRGELECSTLREFNAPDRIQHSNMEQSPLTHQQHVMP
jgi:hypothetical protein